MAQPTAQDVHIDAVLSNISIAYIQSQAVFIASKVFPVVTVNKQSDKYYTYAKNDWFRDEAKKRGDSTESAGSGFTLSTDTYSCDVWAIHKDIGDQARKNADSVLNLDRDATQFVTQRLLMRQENEWVSEFFKGSVWGTTVTGGVNFTLWSDYAGSDPIADIEAGKRAILAVTGFMANTLVMGYDVFVKLQHHPDIVDRYKYTSSQVITADMLSKLFGVDRILVAMAVMATNVEGETAAYSFTHGKHALLAYVNPSPGLLAPSAGYIFAWSGVSAGLGANVGISRMRIDLTKSDRIEGEVAFDNKIVATDLGYFFSGAVA